MMKRAGSMMLLLIAAAQGCDSGGDGAQQASLQLVVSDAPLELVAPTSVLIQLIVIGSNGDPVTITMPGAPAFASLSGTLLTLAPTRADVGSHEIPLVATTATQQANASIRVDVTRTNTGPMWLPIPVIAGTETSSSPRPVVPQAAMYALVCDDEGDNFTFEVEVVPAGTAFTGVASYSQAIDFAVTPPLSYELPSICGEFRVPLTGLAPGDYDVSIHAVDALGLGDPYGWVQFRGFTLAP